MLSLSRNLGLITGASVMGAVFAFGSGTVNITTAHPHAIAAGMRTTFVVAAMLIVVALAIAIGTHAGHHAVGPRARARDGVRASVAVLKRITEGSDRAD